MSILQKIYFSPSTNVIPSLNDLKSACTAVKYIIDARIASASSSIGTGCVLIHIIDLSAMSRPHPATE